MSDTHDKYDEHKPPDLKQPEQPDDSIRMRLHLDTESTLTERPTHYTPEVLTGNIDKWVGNPDIVFATHDETEGYVRDLAQHWTEVKLWRVIKTTLPVTYRWNRWTGLQPVSQPVQPL